MMGTLYCKHVRGATSGIRFWIDLGRIVLYTEPHAGLGRGGRNLAPGNGTAQTRPRAQDAGTLTVLARPSSWEEGSCCTVYLESNWPR
jgi:hypothetical protein